MAKRFPSNSSHNSTQLNRLGYTQYLLLGWVSLNLVCVGCSRQGDGPITVPVTGTLTYQGKPVVGGTVVFQPRPGQENARAAQADTDENGQFEMATFFPPDTYQPGMIPGEYAVTARKMEVDKQMLRPPRDLLPAKFADPSATELNASVTEPGPHQFEFDIP